MNQSLALLIASAMAADNISGEIKTLKTYTYGKFITRMQAPDANGTVSSFFTFWDGPEWYDGGWNEIDVEIVPSMKLHATGYPEVFSTNILYGNGSNSHTEDHTYVSLADPTDMHTYEIEWTPEHIKWSLDGITVRTVDAGTESVDFTNKA